MEPEIRREPAAETEQATAAQFNGEVEAGEVSAWQEIDTGRYMPGRIKGSCKGRALG